MSRNNQCARLHLRTFDIQTYNGGVYNISLQNNVNNEFGNIQSRGQWIQWRNVNIRHLMGDLWDKYSMFNLCLKTIVRSNRAALVGMSCSIWMTGLNWVNQSYSVTTKSFTREACIGAENFILSVTDGDVANYTNTHKLMFKRGNPVVDLTIELKNSVGGFAVGSDGRTEKINTPNGHCEYIFEIYGVKGYETDISETEIPTHNVVSKDTSNNRFYVN
jgi:hypothetical protein